LAQLLVAVNAVASNDQEQRRIVVVHFPFGPRGSTVSGKHLKSEGGSLA